MGNVTPRGSKRWDGRWLLTKWRIYSNIWVWINTYQYHFQGDEHPFTSYFDVHRGYKVLTHCHIVVPNIQIIQHFDLATCLSGDFGRRLIPYALCIVREFRQLMPILGMHPNTCPYMLIIQIVDRIGKDQIRQKCHARFREPRKISRLGLEYAGIILR